MFDNSVQVVIQPYFDHTYSVVNEAEIAKRLAEKGATAGKVIIALRLLEPTIPPHGGAARKRVVYRNGAPFLDFSIDKYAPAGRA